MIERRESAPETDLDGALARSVVVVAEREIVIIEQAMDHHEIVRFITARDQRPAQKRDVVRS